MDSSKVDRILDVARTIFLQYGFRCVTMDDICSAARVSKRSLYQSYRSKEDLFAEVFIRDIIRSSNKIQNEVARIPGPKARLEKVIRLSIEHPQREDFIAMTLRRRTEVYPPMLRRAYQEQVETVVVAFLSRLLEEGISAGEMRPLNTRTAAYIIFRSVQAFTIARGGSLVGDKIEQEDLISFIMNAIKIDDNVSQAAEVTRLQQTGTSCGTGVRSGLVVGRYK